MSQTSEEPGLSSSPETEPSKVNAELTAPGEDEETEDAKSALQDNIDRKGNNAYYFAHSHKATGPEWDGKIEPKLLSKSSSSLLRSGTKTASFEYHKSNITSYAFSDDETSIKIYINMEGVGEQCKGEDDVALEYTDTSFCLIVRNYTTKGDGESKERCLSFGRLYSKIKSASFRKKKDRIVLTLSKQAEGAWPAIAARGGATGIEDI